MKGSKGIDFQLEEFVDRAIAEDVGSGDHTSMACIPKGSQGRANLLVKASGLIAGVEVAKSIFNQFDPALQVEQQIQDGSSVEEGQIVFHVAGDVASILTTERLVLNLMQRMSGIATVTNQYVQAIKHTEVKVLDTRKTTPGLRWFEKEAVRIGGGQNHRFGLFDMILIKDNHIDACGGIHQALDSAQEYLKKNKLNLNIELEVRSEDELEQAISHGLVDRIMLDNFMVSATKEAVQMVNGKIELESSGGITLATIRDYAETGVDFVSIGALTHSVKSLDLSLKIVKE